MAASMSETCDHVEMKVELGFVESVDPGKLTSKYFPSKTGGKPAWLRLKELPTSEQLLCGKCNKPMLFLLQVYAPIDLWEHTFHRTLFVFVCKSAECYGTPHDASNFIVFRAQLGRRNEFYGYDPPEQTSEVNPSVADYAPVCALCGCLGLKRCARCHTNYCSKEHQTLDWKSGHKQRCNELERQDNEVSSSSHLIAEFEIVTEPEEEESDDEHTDRPVEERMREYDALYKNGKDDGTEVDDDAADLASDNLSDLEAMASHQTDKQFRRFTKRVSRDPNQVIRYQRGGVPLWVSLLHQPDNDGIPPCECGAPRIFEFQILPQLLNHLKLDTIEGGVDWGTVAIYTCSKSCEHDNRAYHPEFVWKQDISVPDIGN